MPAPLGRPRLPAPTNAAICGGGSGDASRFGWRKQAKLNMVSRPPISADSMGPVMPRRRPIELRTTASIASAEAMPAAHKVQASRRAANWMRLPMKPATSLSMTTGCLPTARRMPQTRGARSGAVSGPAQTSTSGMSCGGYQKCVAMTRSRRRTLSTSSLARCPLEEASTAAGAQILSSRPKISRFSAMSSGTASMTSEAAAASSNAVVVAMRASAASARAALVSPCAANSERLAAIFRSAAARLSSLRPMSRTCQPAAAKISAMPWPMMPLPMTAINGASWSAILPSFPTLRSSRGPAQAAPVLQDLARGVVAGNTRDAAARMAVGAALIERRDGRAVIGVMRHRALEEELIGRQLAMKDVALRQADDLLEIGRKQHLHVDDAVREAGREVVDDAEHVADEVVALLRPVAVLELVGRVAAEEVDDMLGGGGQRVVEDGRHDGGDEGPCRIPAVFGVVIGAFEIVDIGREMNVGRVRKAGLRRIEGAVARRRLGGDIDLEGGREGAEAADLGKELARQMLGRDELLEEGLAIGVGDDGARREAAPVGGADAGRAAIRDHDLGDLGPGQHLHAEARARGGDRLGDAAHPALDEAPAAGALMLAHDVVHDDIGRARRFRAGEGADRGVIGQHRLDDVALEPAREEIVGALRQEIDDAVGLASDLALAPQERRRLLEGFPVAARRIDRRLEEELAHDRGRLLEIGVEFGIDLGVVPREARELGLRLLRIVAEDDVVAIVERAEEVVGGQHFEAELAQLEIGDDARMQEAHHIGEDGGAEARREFLGDGGSADDVPPLQHQHPEPRLGEVAAADEAVMPGADDDRVVLSRHPVPPLDQDCARRSCAICSNAA